MEEKGMPRIAWWRVYKTFNEEMDDIKDLHDRNSGTVFGNIIYNLGRGRTGEYTVDCWSDGSGITTWTRR